MAIERSRDEQIRMTEVLAIGIAKTSTILVFDFRKSDESKPLIMTMPFEQNLSMLVAKEDRGNARVREVYQAAVGYRTASALRQLRPEIGTHFPVSVRIVDSMGDFIHSTLWNELLRSTRAKSLFVILNNIARQLLDKEKFSNQLDMHRN